MLHCFCLMILSGLGQITIAQSNRIQLPGAQPVIEAAFYPSIQAALDAVPEGGGLVRLPAGKFTINEPLRVSVSDTSLIGSGTSTHIYNANDQGLPAILVADPECQDAKRDREHSLWRVRIADLRITGNQESGAGIEARQSNEILLHGVTVSNNGGDGILLDYCYEDPRIANCLLTYNGNVGLNLIGCHDIVVSGCQFEENQDALHCIDGFNLCMNGCCLDDHLRDGIVIENTYGSVVSGNMIEECQGTAIILERDCYGITLGSNVIAHNGAGIDLRDAHGCSVSANTFTIVKTRAIRVGPDSGRIVVVGNSFSDSYVGDNIVRRNDNDRFAAGIVLEGAGEIAISGNQFSGLSEKALTLLEESNSILFTDNLLSGVASDHAKIKSSVVTDNQVVSEEN